MPTVPDLVHHLMNSGQWPPPDLLEEILACGRDAVEPLNGVLKEDWRGKREEGVLWIVLGLIRTLSATAAISALIELITDRSIRWYGRFMASAAAVRLARARKEERPALVEVLRDQVGALLEKASPSDADGHLAAGMIWGLARLGDAQAVALAQKALRNQMLKEPGMTAESIQEACKTADISRRPPPVPFLERYRGMHEEHLMAQAWLADKRAERGEEEAPREPEPPPPPEETAGPRTVDRRATAVDEEPRRRTAPGRNDPCWCGSGKKYKKCHLDADSGS
jgi:hypothetical protein